MTVDCVKWFYQWLVIEADRYKFTVNSHRGQEYFKVALMRYCNSVQYVQRQLDRILKDLPFAKAYVDDVYIYSATLEEHIDHLHAVFQRFDGLGVSLAPDKSFIFFGRSATGVTSIRFVYGLPGL